jgi:diguanylate cyclase (GGDEF)-like protein/PAS domain S-box-containing protein
MLRIFTFFILLYTSLFANEKVILQLKWLHQFQFAGYYAALEKGFYKELGLDVTIKERDITKNNIEQVISGEAQYGVADSIILLYRAKNQPVVIVTPILQHSPTILMTLKKSGLDSPYALGGKKLVFYENDTDGFSILAMLKTLDISPQVLRTKTEATYVDLIEGKVDAYSGYLTNEPYYFKERNIDINILNPANYGADLYGDMLFTNDNEAKNHPDRVEKFRKATLKGWKYALDHKEEIIQLIHKKYAPNKSLSHLRYEADGIEQMIQYKTIPLGTLDKGRLEYTINSYKKFGLIEQKIPINEYVFDFFQHKAMIESFSFDEVNYLRKKHNLNVCVNPDKMPFEKIEKGKYIGMAADYISLIEKSINVHINYVPTKSWSESLELGRAQKCDIFALIVPLEDRKDFLNFTKPYMTEPLVLATRIEELFLDDLYKIQNKTVAIVKNYAAYQILKNRYRNINFIEVENITQGLKLVNNKEIFGMIDSLTTLGYHIQKEYVGQIKILSKVDINVNLSIGVRSDEPILLGILNKAIDMISSEEKQNIRNKWISINYEQSTNFNLILRWIAGISIIFIIITFVIVKANRKLTQEIQNRKLAEQKLTRYIDLVDKYIIISSTDLAGVITEVSDAFCRVSGYSKEELIGAKHSIIRCPFMPKEFYKLMWKDLIKNGYWEGEIRNKSKNGQSYWVRDHISALYDDKGNKIGFTGINENITDKKLLEEISITDELTKIYNRRHFNDVFPKILNSAKRSGEFIVFSILDIDNFKLYNDTYGHQEGDNVLIKVANTLNNSLSRADDFCFRLGGEEFGLLFKTDDIQKSIDFVENVRLSIEDLKIRHEKNDASSYVTASFGMVLQEASKLETMEKIYKEADTLLYKAKENGRNRVVVNMR